MPSKDPNLSGLQRSANAVIYTALLSMAFLLLVGAAALVRLVF